MVEDDDDLRASISDVLAGAGFVVSEARHGAQALELLSAGPRPDAILLDLMMPVMDGWEFRVRQKRAPELSIPVVVMTANSTSQAIAIDADRVLPKPFTSTELLQALDDVLEQARRRGDPLGSLVRLADGVSTRVEPPTTEIVASLRALEELHWRLNAEPSLRQRIRQTILDGLSHAEALRRLIRDLRTFSRVDDGMRTPVDPRSVLEAAMTQVLARTRARVRIRAEHDDVPPVAANQGRLAILLSHVITNAVEAARSEVTTRIAAHGREVVIEISDDGAGLSPEHARRAFEPFFSTKPLGAGSGLGLSVAHGIARSLGGRIALDSTLGRGATVRISLPTQR
jgi:signal transduction histidine kinase